MMRVAKWLRGPGHASCKEMSVATQDGPNRHLRFRLKRINQDFGRVLCMADVKTLRKTADEILGETNRQPRNLALLTDRAAHSSVPEVPTTKSKAFWTVFSKRFKASMHILSASDIVHVLKAFDASKQDTGVYVAAVLPLRQNVHELDKAALINALHVLSRRLRKNTQQQLFRALANHVPNVMWQMNATEITATLWYLSHACHTDAALAAYMQPKFCILSDDLKDIELGTAALAFARHGHSDERLFEHIKSVLPIDCSGEALFRAAWGLHMAGFEVAGLLHERVLTCLEHVRGSDSNVAEIWRSILRSTEYYNEVFGPSQQAG